MVSARLSSQPCQLGKVVKSTSHCDYVVQLDTRHDVDQPPGTEDYGFGQFVRLADSERHWAVGIIYNSQLFNSAFLNSGPRLTTTPDPIFTPDLIQDTLTLLSVVLVGSLRQSGGKAFGQHGIPRVVVPVNTPVYPMTQTEIHRFHHSAEERPQFCYYSHLLHSGGSFAAALTQQVLTELIDSGLFPEADQRALQVLCKELSWKSTMGLMR
ncbi:hypothetical protein IQ241_23040 [Romeria aff. gracilis LEGE 07310]|uniref:DUF8166 domain-containing protein n=1 Tax=Vasconcelosia minhoensis LEGE 07310 TaxID=915328 RepID=A0A8J7AYH1_9CYAN|nr:hypothetical protein [Romeria gracilis]MBE9080133.1 hypothetical protein [Romeria aff. gracilis LEGE 07310]